MYKEVDKKVLKVKKESLFSQNVMQRYPLPPIPGMGPQVVVSALNLVGQGYAGLCSMFVAQSLIDTVRNNGHGIVQIDPTAIQEYGGAVPVNALSYNHIPAGDIVFFRYLRNPGARTYAHVAISMGAGVTVGTNNGCIWPAAYNINLDDLYNHSGGFEKQDGQPLEIAHADPHVLVTRIGY